MFPTYVITFQLDLNLRTSDLNPFAGVNSSPLEALKMIVLLCCPSVLSGLASYKDTISSSSSSPSLISSSSLIFTVQSR